MQEFSALIDGIFTEALTQRHPGVGVGGVEMKQAESPVCLVLMEMNGLFLSSDFLSFHFSQSPSLVPIVISQT